MTESKSPPDFFDSSYGLFTGEWRSKGRAKDLIFDLRLRFNRSRSTSRSTPESCPQRNILAMGVKMPLRTQEFKNVMQALSRTHHKIDVLPAPFEKGRGKFQNINTALQGVALDGYDWLVIADDDIILPANFLSRFITLAEKANLHICMPAHRFRSFQSFEVTCRHWNSLARVTHFVECGPVTAFRRSVFPHVLPFPDSRWGWGTDILWSETARRLGLPIGVVDATPLRHLRPVSVAYDKKIALREAKTLLNNFNITRKRHEILQTVETLSAL